MNKRKQRDKEEGRFTEGVDKGVVEPFRESKSKLLKLAFSVFSDKDDGIRYLYTMISTLRDNVHLPVLATMFSERHIDSLVYIDKDKTTIFIDRNVHLFQHIIERLRIPTMDISVVPNGLNQEEWKGELDYWGYSTHEIKAEPEVLARHIDYAMSENIDLQARAILSILEKFKTEKNVDLRLQSDTDSRAKLVLWFLVDLEMPIQGKDSGVVDPLYKEMKVADWLWEWGSRYKDYFKENLDVSDIKIIKVGFDTTLDDKGASCHWPSAFFKSAYSPRRTGHVNVVLYFNISHKAGKK